MSDLPAESDQLRGEYRVDVTESNGVVIGEYNTQINIYTSARRPRPSPLGPVDSPYPGLRPFGEGDAPFFFGREAAVTEVRERIADRLKSPGLLVVSGVSGAGKSSLLRAGVLAGAASATAPELPPGPRLVIAPGRSPLQELAIAIAPLAGASPAMLRDSMRGDSTALALAARAAARQADRGSGDEEPRLILVVDQFEQVFTQCADEGERREFVAALHSAATMRLGPAQLPPALVILVVRADFEAQCAQYDEMVAAVQDRYLLTSMTEAQLRLAIASPVGLVSARIEGALVDELLRAMHSPSATGLLPHLSHALDQAWRARAAEDVLSLADYARAGGVEGSIAASADRAFGQLTTAQQAIAQPVFMRLVTTSSDLVVSAGRAPRAELAEGAAAADVDAVIETFAAQRLLTLGDGYVEISHEVLLAAWGTLREWLDGDKIDMARYSRLAGDAREWEARDRPAAYLYAPGRLAEVDTAARRWAALPRHYPPLSASARAFLEAARHARQRSQRLRRRVITILSALTVAAAATAVLATHYAATATQDATRVRQAQAVALSRALAAQSLNIAQSDPTTAQQLAVAAWDEAPTSQAASSMTTLLEQQQHAGELPVASLANAHFFTGGVGVPDAVMAFSPDGRLMATASGASGEVRLWETATWRPAGILHDTRTDRISGVAFSPDGKLVGDAGVNDVQLWDVATGKPVRTLLSHASRDFTGLAFSSDSKLVVTTGIPNVMLRWSVATGKPIGEIAGIGFEHGSVAFSPNGELLAGVSQAGYAQLWNAVTGMPIRTLGGKGVSSVALSPNGELLASAYDEEVQLWNLDTGHAAGKLHLKSSPALGIGGNDMAFSPDGGLFAIAQLDDDNVGLWDTATGREVGILPTDTEEAGNGGLNGVAFNPVTGLLASADGNGTVQLWNTATRRPLGAAITAALNDLAVFSSSATLLGKGADGYIEQLPLTELAAGGRQSGSVRDRRVLPQGEYSGRWILSQGAYVVGGGDVVAVSLSGDIRLFVSTASGVTVKSVRILVPQGHAVEITLSPNESLLAAADFGPGQSGRVTLWKTATGKPTDVLPFTFQIYGKMAFSPDGKLLATTSESGQVTLWSTKTNSPALTFQAGQQDQVQAIAFSQDSKTIVTDQGLGDTSIKLWDAATGRLAGTLRLSAAEKTSGGASAFAFSPDGKLLAAGNEDGSIQLWSLSTRAQVGAALPPDAIPPANIYSGNSEITALTFSPDGNLLLSADGLGDIQPWQTWMFANPYAALCDDVGPPSSSVWATYEQGTTEPPGICSNVPPASALGD